MSDKILEQYPKAKPCPVSTPGYAYDFGEYTIAKNISGTGGWVLVIKDPYYVTTGHSVDDCVRIAEEKLNV